MNLIPIGDLPTEERGRPSRLVGSRFNEHRTLHTRLVLGGQDK